MQGARKYAELFGRSEQIERLYFVTSSHARGKTFRVYLLPENEEAKPNGNNAPLNKDAIEVYGIIGGQSGWTEYYGWIHKGKWCDDFYSIVKEKESELIKKESIAEKEISRKEQDKENNINKLLSNY